jgi:hypothetical protein
MEILNRNQILEVSDVKIVGPIEVPEWNGIVFLRSLSCADMESISKEATKSIQLDAKGRPVGKVETSGFRSRLLARSLCDAQGQRLLEDADADELGKRSSVVIGRLFDQASDLNGLSAKAQEEIAANFPETPGKETGSV